MEGWQALGVAKQRLEVALLRGIFVALALSAAAIAPAWSQSAEELEKQYTRENMLQALETREHYDLYGIHFDSDQSTLQPAAGALLDDIATTLKNFPEWGLRIVGHTDATGDPEANVALSVARAEAIKAALVERGVAAEKLLAAGLGEKRPVSQQHDT